MIWLYRLQQRLSITRQEALALLTCSGLFLLGTGVHHVRQQMTPPLQVPPIVAHADSANIPVGVADSSGQTVGPADSAAAGGVRDETPGRIDVNTASTDRLQALPGIGPALAGRIERFRSRRPFRSTDDLRQVRGIGPKTLERLRPLVSVSE